MTDKAKVSIERVDGLQASLEGKQTTLVSGTNIKTINNNSLLGSENIDLTNTDLSNLTSTGANIANWSNNVTNCITEIPQDIKLELNSGTITLKAGSKVYVPNGAGVFDTVTIASNVSGAQAGTLSDVFYLLNPAKTGLISAVTLYSGNTEPSGTSYAVWYDTTNNRIGLRTSGSSTFTFGYSLPICIGTIADGAATSIDQVFNGFGYIGSTIFALPGVKGLIPNGRNADGTLKSIEFTVSNVLTSQVSGTANVNLVLNVNGFYISNNTFTYDEDSNFNYQNNNKLAYSDVGLISISSGVISSSTPKTAFHALDYNDSSTISGWSMPSSRYDDLTLGASGTTYTAPVNGWFAVSATSSTASRALVVFEKNNGIRMADHSYSSTTGLRISIPCKRGNSITFVYDNCSITSFQFVYAEGEI